MKQSQILRRSVTLADLHDDRQADATFDRTQHIKLPWDPGQTCRKVVYVLIIVAVLLMMLEIPVNVFNTSSKAAGEIK